MIYSSTSASFRILRNAQRPLKEHAALFNAISKEQWTVVQQLYEAVKDYNPRNRVGAAPVHAIFLAGHRAAGKAFLEKNPECFHLQYEGDRFRGENLLHMAIVQRDAELAEWLLERAPTLLNAEAIGYFFDPAGDAYMGGYPLLFAVSSDQPLILKLILNLKTNAEEELKDYIGIQDRFGNTALHLAIIHDLPFMYDLILDAEAAAAMEIDDEPSDPLQYVANDEKLTPLSLAAAMGKVLMFQHILSKNVKRYWDWGPLSCDLVPLRGLEQPIVFKGTPTPPKSPKRTVRQVYRVIHSHGNGELRLSDSKLAINCICAGATVQLTRCLKMNSGKVLPHVAKARLQLLMLDNVLQLLEQKWEAFGKRRFCQKFAMVLGTQLLWVISSLIPNHYRYAHSNLVDHPIESAFIIAIEAGIVVLIMWRGLMEVYQRSLKGRKGTALVSPLSQTNDMLAVSFSSCYLIAGGCRIAGFFAVEDIFAALAAVAGWLHVLFFLVGFRSTGPFIIMIQEMVTYDLRRFGIVYITMLLGFTMAQHQVVHPVDKGSALNFFEHMQRLVITSTLTESPFAAYSAAQCYWLATALGVVYIILVVILLLNLLIAMMGNTYNEIASDADRRWYAERGNMMAAFEDEVPVEKMHAIRQRYAFPPEVSEDYELQPMDVDLYLKVTYRQSWNWRLEVPEREERRTIQNQEAKEWKMIYHLAWWHSSPMRRKNKNGQEPSFADIVMVIQKAYAWQQSQEDLSDI